MVLSKDFSFDAAHQLTRYHGKCERLHGHTYKLRVTEEGVKEFSQAVHLYEVTLWETQDSFVTCRG